MGKKPRDLILAGPVGRSLETAYGWMRLAYTETGLFSLELPAGVKPPEPQVGEEDPAWLCRLERDMRQYLAGDTVRFDIPVDYAGYPSFFRRALVAAMTIPYGQTRTYAWLALHAGSPGAARAAGQAMAHNRTAIVIPCHRILGSDGSLGGYSGGPDWKRKLLALENIPEAGKKHAY